MSSDGGDSPVRENNDRKEFIRKDFNRKEKSERIGGGNYEGPVDDGFSKFLRNLMKERDSLDPEQFPSVHRLIQSELDKVSKGSYGGFSQEQVFIDLYNDPPVTLQAKAMPPSRLFPKFNYAGRIIGPKGSYLKALMKETSTKMVLLGKGVMKDKEKEEELRLGNDPKYIHLNEDMHVSIQATAPASEAYKRMAYAINCLKEQVLSDNRTLENLPWISNANRVMEGGRPDSNSRYSQPQRSYQSDPPPPRHQPRSSASYDYGEPPSPTYRRYPHEMSPPPRRSDPMKNNYGDPYRQMDNSRGGEYVDRRGSSSGGMRSHPSRSPPPPSRSYPPPAYEDPYASYYGSTDSYYPQDNGSYSGGPAARGGGKSASTRYVPYKK